MPPSTAASFVDMPSDVIRHTILLQPSSSTYFDGSVTQRVNVENHCHLRRRANGRRTVKIYFVCDNFKQTPAVSAFGRQRSNRPSPSPTRKRLANRMSAANLSSDTVHGRTVLGQSTEEIGNAAVIIYRLVRSMNSDENDADFFLGSPENASCADAVGCGIWASSGYPVFGFTTSSVSDRNATLVIGLYHT